MFRREIESKRGSLSPKEGDLICMILVQLPWFLYLASTSSVSSTVTASLSTSLPALASVLSTSTVTTSVIGQPVTTPAIGQSSVTVPAIGQSLNPTSTASNPSEGLNFTFGTAKGGAVGTSQPAATVAAPSVSFGATVTSTGMTSGKLVIRLPPSLKDEYLQWYHISFVEPC